MKRKAISIRQPWIYLILRPDIIGDDARRDAYAAGEIKDVENREREIGFSGEVYLHASKSFGRNNGVTGERDFDTIRLNVWKWAAFVRALCLSFRLTNILRAGSWDRSLTRSSAFSLSGSLNSKGS